MVGESDCQQFFYCVDIKPICHLLCDLKALREKDVRRIDATQSCQPLAGLNM